MNAHRHMKYKNEREKMLAFFSVYLPSISIIEKKFVFVFIDEIGQIGYVYISEKK